MAENILPKNEIEQSPDGTIRKRLAEACSDAIALDIARDIVETMRQQATPEQLDFDFHVNSETGGMAVAEAYMDKNVWFRFDTTHKSALAELKKAEFLADCNVDELDLIDEYHRKICRAVKEYCASDVEQVLRDRMFQGKNVPVKLIEVVGFEMIDFSQVRPEENVVLSIEKHVPKSEVDNTSPVAAELYKINGETGEDFNAILKRKQEEGDINYKYITKIHVSKAMWECQIDFFVDFSADKKLFSGAASE